MKNQNEVTAFHYIKLLLNNKGLTPEQWWKGKQMTEKHWVRWKPWALPMPSSDFQSTILIKQRDGRARRSKAISKFLSTSTTNPQHKSSFVLTLSIQLKEINPLLSGQWKEYKFRNILFMRHKYDRKAA